MGNQVASMVLNDDRAAASRRAWLEHLSAGQAYRREPETDRFWDVQLDSASADELRAIQDRKVELVTPFLFENSAFYRSRFNRLGLAPSDIRSVDDLINKWPVVEAAEFQASILEHPPYGTYTTVTDAIWRERGWMTFSSSGTLGAPKLFRYTLADRSYWHFAMARCLHALGIRKTDSVIMCSGFGPHVWAWGVHYTLGEMGVPVIPAGGLSAEARAALIIRQGPSVLLCTPSYALHLASALQHLGFDPAETSIQIVFVAGEPATAIPETRRLISQVWDARLGEFYGCTEAAPHGGFSCTASYDLGAAPCAHVLDDLQLWETVVPHTNTPTAPGALGLSVCTNLNSESSPQLRFLVGDLTRLSGGPCTCGRVHTRAMGCFGGRVDDTVNVRGLKLHPSEIEGVVRSLKIDGEFRLLISTAPSGLDVAILELELPATSDSVVVDELEARLCAKFELRVDVVAVSPGTFAGHGFKVRRVVDSRSRPSHS